MWTTMICPSNETWAYLAGILDGEGTFTVVVGRRRNRKKAWHRGMSRSGNGYQLMPMITFGIKGIELPFWAKATFDCGLYYPRQVADVWQWRVTKFAEIAWLLTNLLPYLRVKKFQAETLLGFVQQRQNEESSSGRYHAPYSDRSWELAETVRHLNGNPDSILKLVV